MNNNAMKELAVAGINYRVGRLNALQQFHVTRRLGPALVVLGITGKMVADGMKVDLDDMVHMAGPVMEVLSKMSDEDTEYVIFTCLRVVQRQQGELWSGTVSPDGKALMFADMDMPAMIRLVVEVLRTNLENFWPGLSEGLTTPPGSDGQQSQGAAGRPS